MKNVLEYLEITATKYPQHGIFEDTQFLSYQQLFNQSKRLGTALAKEAPPKSPIPIFMEKGISCLMSFLGSVSAGCFYVLLNPSLPKTRLEQIWAVLKTNLILTDRCHQELLESYFPEAHIVLLEELLQVTIEQELLDSIRQQALDVDPLYANFTSGSTGIPKGVVVSHRSTIDFIDRFVTNFQIEAEDRIGNQAPFDFDVSVKDLYSALKTGASLVIIPKSLFSQPAPLLDYIIKQQVTTLIWAVSALCLITTFHGLDYKVPTKVRKVLFSGEEMPMKHLKEWMFHLPEAMFVNLYGPTEITCNCTYHIISLQDLELEKLPIGKAFDNEEVFLLDTENQRITVPHQIGELCVRGTALALGYYNAFAQTEQQFVQNPCHHHYRDPIYKTGDLAYFDERGLLYFSGRKDFQIKYMGHRIELEEIERFLTAFDEVKRSCCVFDEQKSRLYAFYIGTLDPKELRTRLKEQLPIFMIPSKLISMEIFPLTKNGKIDRKQLLASIGGRNHESRNDPTYSQSL